MCLHVWEAWCSMWGYVKLDLHVWRCVCVIPGYMSACLMSTLTNQWVGGGVGSGISVVGWFFFLLSPSLFVYLFVGGILWWVRLLDLLAGGGEGLECSDVLHATLMLSLWPWFLLSLPWHCILYNYSLPLSRAAAPGQGQSSSQLPLAGMYVCVCVCMCLRVRSTAMLWD